MKPYLATFMLRWKKLDAGDRLYLQIQIASVLIIVFCSYQLYILG